MFINQFGLQHIADRQGEYRTSNAHQSFALRSLDCPLSRCERRTSVRGKYLIITLNNHSTIIVMLQQVTNKPQSVHSISS